MEHYTLPRKIAPPRASTSSNTSSSSAATAAAGSSCCFSFAAYARGVMDQLRRRGVQVAPGLTESEFSRIESELGFVFPPELRAMLSEGLPLGGGFPDWRSSSQAPLRARMEQPAAGVCREVARGRLWCPSWGVRPPASDAAVRAASASIAVAPLMVPIHGRCYIPSSTTTGNPVLHVHGAKVTIVGNDLADFFERAPFSRFAVEPAAAALLPPRSSNVLELDELDEEDDPSIHGSCLQSIARNHDFFRRRPSFKASSASSSSRRLLTSSRSAEASPRPSVSSNSSSGSGGVCGGGGGVCDPPRRSIDVALLRRRTRKKAAAAAPPPPIEALLGFTVAAPPWTAKAARRVEFWSELMDLQFPLRDPIERKQGSSNNVGIDSSARLSFNLEAAAPEAPVVVPSPPASTNLEASPMVTPHSLESSATVVPPMVTSLPASSPSSTTTLPSMVTPPASTSSPSSKWLDVYLHDMAGRLRVAGWKEDEICEMMICHPKDEHLQQQQRIAVSSRQSIIRGVALKVGELSDSLKRAGWSVQDVAEALGPTSPSPWQQQQQIPVALAS